MKNECLRYWNLCSTITIDAAVALWCDVEPSELRGLNYSTHCMDAKREAIIDALRNRRLDYESRPVPRSDGRGMWCDAGLDELLAKDGLRIAKESLRRWFLEMPIGDRPAFLFDEARQDELLPDGGEVAEMNTMRALAVMAWILSQNKPAFSINERPNASKIGEAIEPMAVKAFGDDVRGFKAFHKKISKALSLLDGDVKAGMPLERTRPRK